MANICGVPVRDEMIMKLYTGTYQEFLEGLVELGREIERYKFRQALERAIFASRPVDKEVIKKIFKSGETHIDIEKVNEIYRNSFKITGLDYGKYIKEKENNENI